MKTIRMVLGILAIIPIALLADKIFFRPVTYDEHSLRTWVYYAIGVPILIFNLWIWMFPEIIEPYFFGRKDEDT